MGLFDWIGETIGNACSAIAEFFGDVFEVVATSVLSTLYTAGDALLKQMLIEVKGSDTDINSNATALSKLMEDEFIDDPNKAINTALDYEGTLEPGEATRVLKTLYGPIDEHMISGVIFALITEIVSLGQVEGVQQLLAMEDKMKGFSDLASTYRKMQNEIGLFQPYQKELNARYQNLIPGATDNVLFALREVWDKDRRVELLAEPPGQKYYDRLAQNGFAAEIGDDYWASHWVLPSVGQLNEMMHRRVIDDATWDRFVKYNDFDPTVRPWLKAISYNPYTRVDIRRMYDLGLVTRQEVKDNYLDLGYDEEHAEKMTVWTLAYVLAVEMRARYSKGWVTEAEVRTALLETGMPADRVDDYLQKIIKADASERTAKERDLTKTDITRSVKKGLLTKDEGVERLIDMGYSEDEAAFIVDITVSESISAEIEADRDLSKADVIKGVADGVFTEAQGLEMLMKLGYDKTEAQYIIDIRVPPKKPEKLRVERDLTKAEIVKGVKKEILSWAQGAAMLFDMGYDVDEADFILAINIEALTGSPETWSEMQDIINKGRRALHRPVKEIPSGIKDIEVGIKKYTQERKEAVEAKKPRQDIIDIDNKILPLKRQHRQLVEQYQKGS